MKFEIKPFNELSCKEFYQILKLRCEVFIVEQNCPYLDIDNKDLDCLHLLGYDDEELICYCRLIHPGVSFESASIGRVIVAQKYRREHVGDKMLKVAIDYMENKLGYSTIEISAQAHLTQFYGGHGFECDGEIYLEDDIEHIHMIRK